MKGQSACVDCGRMFAPIRVGRETRRCPECRDKAKAEAGRRAIAAIHAAVVRDKAGDALAGCVRGMLDGVAGGDFRRWADDARAALAQWEEARRC